jgi:pimeloyl-ACP methyl ester carboxylesterase
MMPPAPPPGGTCLNTLAVPAAAPADTLLVLLAGAYDPPQAFIDHGFVDTPTADQSIDLLLVESDLAAVCDGSFAARIEHELLVPARTRGYRRVLTGGISVGGLSALMHADAFPGSSDGLLLLAPYPGDRTVTREIASAGGLRAWTPAERYPSNDERRGWRALRTLADHRPCPLWLGYGASDRFAPGHALMAAALADDAVCVLPGGHDWPTWLALWQRWLAR